MMDITREEAIAHYKDTLGNRWKKYGLEIVAASDIVANSTTFDESKGNIEAYLYTILRNQIYKSFSKKEKFCALPNNYDVIGHAPDILLLMKADIEHRLGPEFYQTALDYHGNDESVRAIAEQQKVSVETIRWRLKKLNDYFEKWRIEDV